MDEIIDGVWLGGIDNPEDKGVLIEADEPWNVVLVHESKEYLPHELMAEHNIHWIPVMTGSRGEDFRCRRRMLDAATEIVRCYHENGERVALMCGHGIERAPATMAWYLDRFQFCDTLTEAYDLIEERRPAVQRRAHWYDFD